ncbi:MAG TPA: DUF1330 domain-containing protein [Casimicrobiaceae bacterium]|jgi:uncharacterized protein (DUF1330 family)|nr:DUF1330 domain-containing protein [Casimicrobiaceae bacterium]
MPKGYWIVHVDLKDPGKYKGYMAATVEPFRKHGARYLVRAGRFENPDGTSRSRHAVIEFPSYDAALACFRSAEYQEARKLRLDVATMDVVVVEGYEGQQPA